MPSKQLVPGMPTRLVHSVSQPQLRPSPYETDDNGIAILQSFPPKLFKKEIGWRCSRTAAMGKRNINVCSWNIIVHAAARDGICAFTLEIWRSWLKTAHATIGHRSRHRIKSWPTRFVSGKVGECRRQTRRYQVDPWSINRGRENFGGGLRSNPEPNQTVYFLPLERDREFLLTIFYTAAPKCVCIRRLAGARHVSPAVLWTLWLEGGLELLTSAPRSDLVAKSLVLLIDVCRGLGISPFRINIWLSFLRPILAQHLPRNYLLCFLSLNLFWWFVIIASGTDNGTEILWRVSLKFNPFFWQHRVAIVIGLRNHRRIQSY